MAVSVEDRHKFPALLPGEIAVLKTWMADHGNEYDRFDFNVRLGDGIDPGPQFPDELRDMARKITQKRIDVVAYQGQVPTIIEVKERAGPGSIGQILTYATLFRQAHPELSTPKLLIVAGQVSADTTPTIKAAGITLQLVTPEPL